jgi:glycosyltransferase involved in cell wall biosynthesis
MKVTKKKSISFLFPTKELYSSYYGGAVSRCVYEIVSRNDSNFLDVSVIALSCRTDYAYNNNKKLSSLIYQYTLGLFDRVIGQRYEGLLWCFYNIGKIKKSDFVIVENRPHYALFLRRLGYKGMLALHLHNDFFNGYTASYLQKLDKAFDLVIGCSNYILQPLKIKCISLYKKSHILYNGVSEQLFSIKSFSGKRKPQILFAGRIDEGKGIINLVESFIRGYKSWEGWTLLIAGSSSFGGDKKMTEYEISIREMISKNHFDDKIVFLGYIDHDNVLPKLLSEVAIFCLPSIVPEAFPLSILEAMMAGTPIVCTKVGGIPEVLGQDYPYFSETNSFSLQEKLHEMVSNYSKGDEQAKKLQKKASKEYTWELVAKNFFNLIEKVTDTQPVN